ncbi:MAG: hypothetical protein J0L88_06900, partial [Xanthomonadales bacterium]|nr:hypothetical protein [Xanthomonadales bacterium]
GACAHAPTARVANADAAGRMRGYIESSRVTDLCPDPGKRAAEDRCVVTRGFDYTRGETVVRMYDPAGRLVLTEHPPGADVSLTPIEHARVEALMRVDARTAPIVNRTGVVLWAGGFVVREPGDRQCNRRSRCVRAIAADDGGNNVILHSVVDLMTDRVVHPFYEPAGGLSAGHPGKP